MAMNQDEAQARSELLLRDAEEALQQERLREFWTQWGSTIIGMCLMLVVGTGAGVAWREWRDARDQKSTAQLMAVVNNPAIAMTPDAAKKMTGTHAAIGWLAKTGDIQISDAPTPEQIKSLETAYNAAAKAGDDTPWGWLGRWNALRLKMDDPSVDAEKLIKQFDDLADDMGKSPLAALPATDAAVIAGERLKDPKRALEYLERAEKLSGDAGPMSVHIADLRHLYQIRAAATPAPESPAQPAKETAQ